MTTGEEKPEQRAIRTRTKYIHTLKGAWMETARKQRLCGARASVFLTRAHQTRSWPEIIYFVTAQLWQPAFREKNNNLHFTPCSSPRKNTYTCGVELHAVVT